MRSTRLLASLAVAAVSTTGIALGTPAGAQPAADRPTALEALASHPGAARDAAGQAFTVTDRAVDSDGTSHVRLDRTYRGLPVVGGDLVVHQAPGGSLEGVSQTLKAPLHLATSPKVGATAAAVTALAPTKLNRSIDGQKTTGTPQLVVDATGATPRLAWKVMSGGTQSDGTPSRLATYVDAASGAVLRAEQEIQTAEGSGQSLYSGTVPVQVTQSGSSYLLKDGTRGGSATSDMNNKEDSLMCQIFGSGCTNGTVFSSPDLSFGNGTNGNRESAGVDAAYGGAETFDYFKLVHGRNGIFGNGTGAPSRVHYGSGYVNAFWDGSKMTYGDGDGVDFGPLVSLDVAGHEMSHGVTENTANLTYSGESGGLNESTSDIFGTMVEFYANNANDAGDYLIGEEFDLKQHVGFRRMDKPSSDGASYDCYDVTVGQADVHYSSGVGNHFFYLLAEGSGAKTIGGVAHNSPTCNGSTVAGIGSDAAAKIWFRALSTYMTSGTTYSGARTATLNAARDLYGTGSAQYNAVAAAWSAVSVN